MASTFLQLFDALIRLPSVSSAQAALDMGNRPVIDLLAERFSALGFTCEILPLATHPQKANLIATLGRRPGGLVLSGHTDTVPFDAALWASDPLRLTERDNRLYGLGSTDMKGFFALVHDAVQGLDAATLRQPLIVLATADEESSMDGARALVQAQRQLGRKAVIGEPTGLKPINRHKGVMMERLRVQGQSGHSSNPTLGRSALDAMHEMIGALLNFRTALKHKYRNPHFVIDVPTLNLGVIHGGDNPNRICGHCELEFDVRLLPGMGSDSLRADIRHLLTPIAHRHGVEFTFTPLFPGVEPFANEHSELVALCEKLTGATAQSVAFGTEAPFLQQLGLDTVVLGPGSIDVAHQPNEYLALEQIQPCIDLLRKLITRYCLMA
ncbi:MAG: acetylornithine deacetylase [Pseudomonadales bacterium]|jgi:acetylornithine deacetylase|nr:acetylornithine deacetylase [Pseudomonadales bacterium]